MHGIEYSAHTPKLHKMVEDVDGDDDVASQLIKS